MAHDVFVSYSARDKAVADAVCATLESRKIRCWIAPRDVPPGTQWPGALIKAIDAGSVFVLVFSDGSNNSPQVLREVARAVSKGVPVIPFRIEDVQPSDDIGFFIATLHWLDALTPPLEEHLSRLAHTVQVLLAVEGEPRPVAPTPKAPPKAVPRRTWPIWASIILLSLGLLIVLSTWISA